MIYFKGKMIDKKPIFLALLKGKQPSINTGSQPDGQILIDFLVDSGFITFTFNKEITTSRYVANQDFVLIETIEGKKKRFKIEKKDIIVLNTDTKNIGIVR